MSSENVKTVKKEEMVEDENDGKSLASMRQDRLKKSIDNNVTPPSSRTKQTNKVKKEEQDEIDEDEKKLSEKSSAIKPIPKVKKSELVDDDDDDLDELKSKRSSNTKLDKKKKVKVEEKKKVVTKVVETTITKKREKKVYELPGQKRDPPEERDPLRIFYETLYNQMPNSEMAQLWMMESGLLPKEVAKKVLEKKQKKAPNLRLPAKSNIVAKQTTKSAVKSTVRKVTITKESPSTINSGKKKQSAKRKKKDESSSEEDEESENSDDDFAAPSKATKKQKVV